MFLALSIIQKLYDGYKLFTKPVDPEVIDSQQRQKLACYAIEQLDKQGGFFLDVKAVRGKFEGSYSSDIQVSVLFRVAVRPQQYVEQHRSYSIDFSSWKKLSRDLKVLGKIFEEANQRAYPEADHPPLFIITDYTDFIADIDQRAMSEPKL